MRQELKGFAFIILATVLWGLAGTVAKYMFNNAIKPLMLAEIRLICATLLLGLLLGIFARPQLAVDREDWGYLVRLGVFGVAGVQFTYFFTISQTNVATAVFLQYTAPILVALYAVVFKGEKLGLIKVGSLLLAIIGSYLMVFSKGLSITPLGIVSGAASAVCVTVYTIYGKRGLRKYSSWTILFYCFAAGAVGGMFVVPPWSYPPGTFSTGNIGFFAYIAIFATIIPFGAYFMGLHYLQPTVAGITATMEPVVAAVTAFLILNERLTFMQTIGAALVLCSVILVQAKAGPARYVPDPSGEPLKAD